MEHRSVQVDPVVVGQRLRDARRESGLTQEEVALRLGVARTTVVAMEKGERRITPEEFIKLAEVYSRPVNDFLRPGVPLEGLATQFRLALAKAPEAPQLERLSLELQRLAEDYGELERITGSTAARPYPPPFAMEGLPAESVGEQAAVNERSRLGLGDGPVLQLRQLLEHDVGVRVFVLDLPSPVAGLFAYSEETGGCVAINAKHPAERQRWSLAHEYGHFLTARYRPEITLLRSYRRLPRASLCRRRDSPAASPK
jgi:transcriptional regulator with XRE-family HTH domain